jgi:hypothetical protein
MASVEKRPLLIAAFVAETPAHEPDIASYRACISGCLELNPGIQETPMRESEL